MHFEFSQPLWMGVRPSPDLTRVLVHDGPMAVLKARLPEAPQHPRAVETLAEGLALWYARPISVALGVAAADAFCVSPPWRSTVEGMLRTPLVTMDLVDGPAATPARPRRPRRPRRLR